MVNTLGISGGTGFCGKAIISKSIEKKIKVVSYQRKFDKNSAYSIKEFSLEAVFDMEASSLKGVETFVHTAALVHKEKEEPSKYQALNFLATKALFKKCLEAGVKKFIFFSTVGVYGITSSNDKLNIQSLLDPRSPYAKSKLDAENYLIENAPFHDIEVLILRLPLVYGLGAPGNLGLLTKLVRWPIPLPFKGVANRRSMISVDNVSNLVTDIASGKIRWTGLQLIVEPEPFSIQSIILRQLADRARSPVFFIMPKVLMKIFFSLIGRSSIYEQLYEDLVFESSKSLQSLSD